MNRTQVISTALLADESPTDTSTPETTAPTIPAYRPNRKMRRAHAALMRPTIKKLLRRAK